jgi:2-keto-4-pentenoate hydratase/2-oxohepta-3-ene-1,7-dioic acid hydratase in catechol pathway
MLEGDVVHTLRAATLQDLLQERPEEVSLVDHASANRSGEKLALADVRLLAPVGRSGRNVFAIGWNYLDHFEEGARARQDDRDVPDYPTIFTKTPEAIVGPADSITIDSTLTTSWDFEAEIAIVLAEGGRDIDPEKAESHIAGFTLANDVTARDVQRRHGGQWFKGKSLDLTTPIGPYLVTPDELPGGRPSVLSLSVNGEMMQSADIRQMFFDFSRIIAELSVGLTLLRGDVILTGTPSGVGYVRKPPAWLAPGDEVTVSSPGLGELRNLVADRAASLRANIESRG